MINSELDKNLLLSTLSKVNKIAYDISVDTKDVLDRAKLFVDDKLNDFYLNSKHLQHRKLLRNVPTLIPF